MLLNIIALNSAIPRIYYNNSQLATTAPCYLNVPSWVIVTETGTVWTACVDVDSTVADKPHLYMYPPIPSQHHAPISRQNAIVITSDVYFLFYKMLIKALSCFFVYIGRKKMVWKLPMHAFNNVK